MEVSSPGAIVLLTAIKYYHLVLCLNYQTLHTSKMKKKSVM